MTAFQNQPLPNLLRAKHMMLVNTLSSNLDTQQRLRHLPFSFAPAPGHTNQSESKRKNLPIQDKYFARQTPITLTTFPKLPDVGDLPQTENNKLSHSLPTPTPRRRISIDPTINKMTDVDVPPRIHSPPSPSAQRPKGKQSPHQPPTCSHANLYSRNSQELLPSLSSSATSIDYLTSTSRTCPHRRTTRSSPRTI